ncbi:MAG: anaerobic ribonucleoside-triphosphate reductase activating protein [Methanomassiliicoccales archaeon]|nr:anaerobic ribonucleoside-triphosphate reductase activating protein [Methanomassiliicoccales archaeon]NYT14785.1 anaerobic ribonucleoside-triphosphate reductase activating protein [Methanomassiliicoccales archaeon]
MRIVGFIKTSLVDWDGRVSSVIFLPGCNFRCPFCHNRELVLSPGSVPEVDHGSMMLYLEENSDFLDGVVITGGEPTIHSDLPDLIGDLSALGLRVKLDTNGSNPSMLLDLIDSGLLESVAMDIKGPLDDRYDDACGVQAPLEDIKRSISILMDSEIEHEFRTTIVPHIIKEKDVESIAAFIGGARKYALQQFRPGTTLDGRLSKIDPYPIERIHNMAELAKQYVRRVVIRGDI